LSRTVSRATDTFSFAVSVHEVYARSAPWPNETPIKAAKRVLDGERMSLPSERLPAEVVEIVKDAWKQDPAERPSMNEIVERLCMVRLAID